MGSCTSALRNTAKIDRASNSDETLTSNDVELIKNSWKIVVKEGLTKYGVNMMIRVFLEHKNLKPLWRFARGLETAEQMHSNQLLKMHGEKLFNAIDLAINSLDDLGTLVPILIQLGYSHYNWGVREEHFPVNKLIFILNFQPKKIHFHFIIFK
jgi:hemoglobin-like flavoprotein